MNPRSIVTLPRVFYLLRYHRWRQFVLRFIRSWALPLQWKLFLLKLQRSPIPSFCSHISVRPIPLSSGTTSIPFPHYPKIQIPFPELPEKALSAPLLQFEIESHSHIQNLKDTEKAWKIVVEWIQSNTQNKKSSYLTSWHPYVISKRIQNWLLLWSQSPPSQEIENTVLISLWQQGLWLSNNFEKDIEGNHLCENAISLALVGFFLKTPQSSAWWDQGLSTLQYALSQQILDSGEHFEKSPSYHWELWKTLQWLLNWVKPEYKEQLEKLTPYLNKMENFITQIAHPCGTLPYFNDSWLIKVPPSTISSHGWLGDYFITRNSSSFMVFDGGPLGPDFLPAHSHCDLLTFELSIGKKPLFINSGTHSYTGEKRQHFRSSKSHNVLTLNDYDCADTWNSFRMGKRGHVIQKGDLSSASGRWVWASHNGYRFLGCPSVTRLWFISESPHLWVSFHWISHFLEDHHFKEYLHFSPETQLPNLTLKENKKRFSFQHDLAFQCHFQSLLENQCLEFQTTSFAPSFYCELPKTTAILTRTASKPPLHHQIATAWALNVGKDSVKMSWAVFNNKLKLSWVFDGKTFSSEITIPSS